MTLLLALTLSALCIIIPMLLLILWNNEKPRP
mgnify:CR=1 FL=1|jgi:hypothetical protein